MAEQLTPGQLVEVLRADRRVRWQKGERILAEAYLERHPALQADANRALELVDHEVLLREELGEAPQLQEYLQRFPHLGPQLEPLFAVHRVLESEQTLGDPESSLSQRATQPATDIDVGLGLPAIAGYDIQRVLGRGGMGVVYEARHLRLKRVVALKMLLAGAQADAKELARFRVEAEAQARLQHPHIVQIFEVGEADGRPYFALEFVAGGSLDKKLGGIPQPARESAQLVETLARAVYFAHQEGVLHRDLKPANVLLTPDGMPKITDFGLAKRLQGDAGPSQTGHLVGTPSYMAPEQAAEHAQAIGFAVDVYALGAILYEMLTGRPPFLAETTLDTLLQVRSLDPVPPRRFQPKVPRDLQTICLKCLRKEPDKRYASAEDLAEDLRRFQAGEPIRARPVGQTERLWRWGRRNPALAATGSLAAAALVAVTVVSILFGVHEKNNATALGAALQNEQQSLRQAEFRLAENYLDQGLNLCRRGDVARGMLWLAHSMELAPPGSDKLLYASRANLAAWRPYLSTLRMRLDHPDAVTAVAFSPDGKCFLTGAADGSLQLWDAVSGDRLRELLHPRRRVTAVAFSPDGNLILTGSLDRTARLWLTATGARVATFKHSAEVLAATFSPRGESILTGCGDGKAYLWKSSAKGELAEGKEQCRFEKNGHQKPGRAHLIARAIAVQALASPGCASPVLPRAAVALRVAAFDPQISAVAFSPDGDLIATGSADRTVQLWDPEGNPIGKPLLHQGQVTALAFSPDSKMLLTGNTDKHIRLWDVAQRKLKGDPRQYQGILSVAFNPKDQGETFLMAGSDGIVQLWETATMTKLRSFFAHPKRILAMAVSPDGRRVLTGSADRTAQVWNISGVPTPDKMLDRGETVRAVAFGRNGTVLRVYWRKVEISELGTNKLPDTLFLRPRGQSNGFRSGSFSPDGKRVVVARADGTVLVCETATRKKRKEFVAHNKGIRSVVFSPNGQFLLTGSEDNTAQLWDPEKGEPVGKRLKHRGAVWQVNFSPNGEWILTGSEDGTAQIWETATGNPVGAPLDHGSEVLAVAFSPNARSALTGGVDFTARLWDLETRKPMVSLRHVDPVYAVTFSHDGRFIVTGSADLTAQVWDTDTGKPIGPPLPHQDPVRAVAVSPNNEAILTASGFGAGPGGGVQMWAVAPPIDGDAERCTLWAQVMTGMELRPNREVHRLDASTWEQRRRRLQELGGPPLPEPAAGVAMPPVQTPAPVDD